MRCHNKVADILAISRHGHDDPELAVDRHCRVDLGESCACQRCSRLVPFKVLVHGEDCALIAAATKALRYAAFFKTRESRGMKPLQARLSRAPEQEAGAPEELSSVD